MRYVVLGAGAVGSAIGGRLFQHGHDVTLVARGSQLDALRRDGLTLADPTASVQLRVPAVSDPADAGVASRDRVILTVKGQDTAAALDALAATAPADIAVVCAQNGVDNERQALRRFADVYALCVMLPATIVAPGVVRVHGTPHNGILDLGRYPSGVDDVAVAIAADLEPAGFASRAVDQPMRLKRTKLLMNLANALEAISGPIEGTSEIVARARAEAEDCYRAAGLDWITEDEDRARRRGVMDVTASERRHRTGASTWQSLARGTGSVEVDALNGEIVLLGRLHGVPTPANEILQRAANTLAISGAPPGSIPLTTLLAELEQATA